MKEKNMSQEVLAVVAGQEITQADFEAFLQGVPREQQAYLSNPQFREQCLEQMIAMHLFAKKGEEDRLEETEEFKKVIMNAKRDILAQMVMRDILGNVSVAEEEISSYYEAHKEQYKKGETVSAKHILAGSEEKCKEVMAVLESGEKTFEEAAKEYSQCPSGAKGGALGEFGKGQMVKEFEDAAFAAEIGVVVGPVNTQFGCHLIKVEAKKEASIATLEEVKETIRRTLLQQKQNDVYTKTVEELKAKYIEK